MGSKISKKKMVKFVIAITLLLFIITLFSACAKVQKDFQSELFSKEAIAKTFKLENGHPLKYFEVAAEYYRNDEINDAAFLYYVGQLRYRFYLAVNPDYEPGGDLAVFASLQSVLGSEINYKLGEDIDNYIQILSEVIRWGETYDSKYCPKAQDPKQFAEVMNGLVELRTYVIENRADIIEMRNGDN